MALIDLANPTRFVALVDRILPWLAAATLAAFALGLYQAHLAPDDYQQGATVKIMFIHVPAAWLGMFCWGVMNLAALGTLAVLGRAHGDLSPYNVLVQDGRLVLIDLPQVVDVVAAPLVEHVGQELEEVAVI